MFWSHIAPTKEKLYMAAIELYSKHGYDAVSMRDLGNAVGITQNAIYNHFKSKKEILLGLYEAYARQRELATPSIAELLKQAETAPPMEALMGMDWHFPEDIEPYMNKILSIGVRCMPSDTDSFKFIEDNVFTATRALIVAVLTRLVELKKIETINIEAFTEVLLNYCFSAVARTVTPIEINLDKWREGLKYLYSLNIKPIVA
jgi:AcrR family transcriptional regulator